MSATAIDFRNVTKSYGAGNVLENFNLSIPTGKILTLIGPSGCGKTTLLKMINRLVDADAGTILVEGKDIGSLDPVLLRRDIGYVIQQIGLFPHMTIEDNITIVPRLKSAKKKKELADRAAQLLRMVGLEPEKFRRRYPHELSGGQQQRIGVARALASEPSIILMDEPFSALDPISRVQLQNELIGLNQKVGKTIVFVTHDIDEALKIADVIVLLRDGKIEQIGAPDELLRNPASDYVKEFVGPERYAAKEDKRFANHSATARDFITEPVFIPDDYTVARAVKAADDARAEGLIVLNENKVYTGILSALELRALDKLDGTALLSDLQPVKAAPIAAEAPLSEVLHALKRNAIIPVFGKNDHISGVISQASIIEAAAAKLLPEEVKA
ncbi:betaine/proline/choline family ABC transporter ATP-binding protein [Paenibacillus sp. YIM B09110]|uniref:betaine/proline/choline family ABC transporter ATP-binding protein n=1 Tax=Paenibacillus sp. YIM B09110 TaxID=3126102 RepID=UPI00301DAF00